MGNSQDVMIRLKLVADPGNKAAAESVASSAVKSEEARNAKVFQNRAKLLARIGREEARAAKLAEQEAEKSAKKRMALATKAAQFEVRERERAHAKLEALDEKRFSQQKRLAENASKAARGALDMAQGLAVLGISSEQSLEKFVRLYAQIDAGFRVAKGGLDILLGTAEAYKAIQAAAAAAAAAQTASAIASGAGAGAGAGAAAGGAGAAVGAAGGALAGAGLIALFTAAVWEGLAGLGRAAGLEVWSPANAAGNALGGWAGEAWAGDGGNTQREAALQHRRSLIQQQVAAQQSAAAFAASRRDADRMLATATGREDEFNKLELAAARSQVAGASASQNQLGAVRLQEQIGALERLKGIQQHIADRDRDRTQALKQQADQQKELVKHSQDQLKAAQELVAAEERKLSGPLATIGRLGAPEQEALKNILRKKQGGGTLDAADAATLDRLGIGGSLATDVFAKQARAAGFSEDDLRILGETSGLDAARAREQEIAKALAQAKEAEQSVTRALVAAKQTELEGIQQLVDTIKQLNTAQAEASGLPSDVIDGMAGDASAAAKALNQMAREMATLRGAAQDAARQAAQRAALHQP